MGSPLDASAVLHANIYLAELKSKTKTALVKAQKIIMKSGKLLGQGGGGRRSNFYSTVTEVQGLGVGSPRQDRAGSDTNQ